MRLHYLQHVPFEDLAAIRTWAERREFTITNTLLYESQPLPEVSDIDWLVILGGPMNIYEDDRYPWLKQEKEFIARAIEQKRTLVGACLGGQLIADVLGGPVTRNVCKEIGWHPVMLTDEGAASPIFAGLPAVFVPFHWHGDTFAIPRGAVHAACSVACRNQAFVYDNHVLGLQFHFEYERASIEDMLVNCEGELDGGPYCQTPDMIRAGLDNVPVSHLYLSTLLDNLYRSRSNA